MPQTNLIDVTIYPSDSSDVIEANDVNYVSFVSSPGGQGEGTYGIPALLGNDAYAKAIKSEGYPFTILYVNPHRIAAMTATRKS